MRVLGQKKITGGAPNAPPPSLFRVNKYISKLKLLLNLNLNELERKKTSYKSIFKMDNAFLSENKLAVTDLVWLVLVN